LTDRNTFARLVEAFMISEMERLFNRVPGARHLADENSPLNEGYYLRHRIETVKRIWLTSQTDALALAAMVDEDYESARWWSKYIYQELNHDQLYIADLNKHSYTLRQIASVLPYSSTLAMVEYIRNQITRIGSVAAVAYSVWVEWNSDKTSAIVVERARNKYSSGHVKGSHAHVGIDINEDHYSIMLDVVHRLITRNGGDATDFFGMLRQLTDFVAEYFEELENDPSLASFASADTQTALA
jgi:hypothetical protein